MLFYQQHGLLFKSLDACYPEKHPLHPFLVFHRIAACTKGNNKCTRSTNGKFQITNLLAFYYLTNYFIVAVDVTLDADTAHPRLQVSEDGKSVIDTGAIRRVPSKKERFDSHTFVLAKEAYASGKLYWEVDVGKRRNWILGVAQEIVTRKGKVVLSPQNGFWAIGVADGQDYWAYTDPWTRLTVSGRPRKIGIFLDISAKKLLFYNVHQKSALYIFSFHNDCSQEVKLFPFFSTGSAATTVDTEPLQIGHRCDYTVFNPMLFASKLKPNS
uniref:B30.2/SPRY domain-containing protein n=1 Tax=Anas platyrhynchos TaxID=8839 RepID=A0A8B9T2K6_ANAPL